MKHARTIRVARSWPAGSEADVATLTFEKRFARRRRIKSDSGKDILIDLAHAQVIGDGDALLLEDGRLVRVVAAQEELLEVTCANSRDLGRIAWHLGNRHTPAAISADRILVQRDHVLADMLRGLGATVKYVTAAFDPERGAYAGGGHHHHDHGHDHHHERDHEH